MAKHEACELYIEQQIEEGLQEGKTPYSIGKELSDWIAKLFEVRIKPNTLRMRAERHKEKVCTNVQKESQPIETIEDTIPEIIKDRKPQGGGKREGAGRKKEIKSWNNYYTEFINLILKAHEPLKKLTEQPEWELNKHHVIEDMKRLTLIGGC